MAAKDLVALAADFLISKPSKFRLDDIAPDDTRGFFADKEQGDALLREAVAAIAAQQETLYAQNQWSLLLIFQAMDAAGKDSAIEHVFSGVNPQGVQVFSFKAPSAEELDHDFLWRTAVRLPERGRIGVFNRSHYEEVLVVRVHPEMLASARLPPSLVTSRIWDDRFESINAFERHLARNGCVIRKFFLHVSQEEQARRFLKRLEEPAKRWKFSTGDLAERDRWPDYMHAYEQAIRRTSTPHAPWVVVPADRKWFARLVIAGTILAALEDLRLKAPEVSREQERELRAVRQTLEKSVASRQGHSRKRR
ncbi:MAG: polyphosphate kinase 2 family protein [Vicinamibacterales bacterium]